MKKLSVGILEDDPTIADRLSAILSSYEPVEKIHLFGDNSAFSDSHALHQMDILLADIALPDGTGIDSIQLMNEVNSDCLIIVISAKNDANTVMKAIQSGAIGYLHKSDDSLEIVESIESALAGESPISPSIASLIIKSLQKPAAATPATGDAQKNKGVNLTQREIEVLETLASGLSYAEAANILGISKNTLPVHVRNIYAKLNSKNRTNAINVARERGILS